MVLSDTPTIGEKVEAQNSDIGLEGGDGRPSNLIGTWRPTCDQERVPWTMCTANSDGSMVIFCGSPERDDLDDEKPDVEGCYKSKEAFLRDVQRCRME